MQYTNQMGDDQPTTAQQQQAQAKRRRQLSPNTQQQGFEPDESPAPQMGGEIFTDWASI